MASPLFFMKITDDLILLFLAVLPPLSTVLSKFSHIFYFIRVSPLEGVTRDVPSPFPSDATGSRG